MKQAGLLLAFVTIVLVVCSHGVRWSAASSPDKTGIDPDTLVRPTAVAGSFYPADRDRLRNDVEEALKQATKQTFNHPIRAIMAPHAGYEYCSKTMAAVYKQIEGPSFVYDTVALLGPSHRYRTKAGALSSADYWNTPLGKVQVDTEACKKLARESGRLEFDDRIHAPEHSLEVQLPYLLAAARGRPFKIVPILTNSPDPFDHEIVAKALIGVAANSPTLIVLSTDLSHFPPANVADKVDKSIIQAATSLSYDKLGSENRRLMQEGHPGLACTMCGLEAALCLERAVKGLGVSDARLLSYTHSGMAGGATEKVVGYGGVVFCAARPPERRSDTGAVEVQFSRESKKELLDLARSAVEGAVSRKWSGFKSCDNPELQARAGCFVTLKNKGRLRGCIGRFTSDAPLWKTTQEMAVASATQDMRFASNPITTEEVPELDIEVSVLSPFKEVVDPLKEIKLGIHGIVVRDKGRSGTFLPQVATETGWSLEEFLGHCARDKAMIGWDGWKNPSAQIFTYTATIIEEEH